MPTEIHRQTSSYNYVYRSADAICIIVGLILAHHSPDDSSAPMLSSAFAIVGYIFVSEITGLYRNWRGAKFSSEYGVVLLTWGITAGALIVVGTLADAQYGFSRQLFLAWIGATACLFGTSRSLLRFIQSGLLAYGINRRGYAIVGINELGIRLAGNIEKSFHLGMELVGFYDDRPADRTGELPVKYGERCGTLDELVAKTRAGEIDTVYITFPLRAEERTRRVTERLADSTASVYIVPDFFVFQLLHSRWNDILGVPVVSIFENPLLGVHGVLKRALDLVGAIVGLVLFAVPMLLIAALIKMTSPGPVFFRQKRYGLDGREIRVWKFRSMRVQEDGARVVQATKQDPRVTKIGAILRKTSLDEIPQLFNVLTGEMSLVGPRPHANAHNEEYRKQILGYMLRHKVKPGITGLAQVSGWRGETDTLDKMEGRIACDHRYIREWSLGMDIKILLKTLLVPFKHENVY